MNFDDFEIVVYNDIMTMLTMRKQYLQETYGMALDTLIENYADVPPLPVGIEVSPYAEHSLIQRSQKHASIAIGVNGDLRFFGYPIKPNADLDKYEYNILVKEE